LTLTQNHWENLAQKDTCIPWNQQLILTLVQTIRTEYKESPTLGGSVMLLSSRVETWKSQERESTDTCMGTEMEGNITGSHHKHYIK